MNCGIPSERVDSGTIKAAKQMIEDYLIKTGQGGPGEPDPHWLHGSGKDQCGRTFRSTLPDADD